MVDNSRPDISVIMAVYNSEQFLEESIESILNQTFDNFELIIIYDKSTDNSKNIIDKYMKLDDRIILVNNENKIGVAAARNRGLEIARGDYIAIMDSDDISLPNRFEKQLSFLENNKNYFLIGSNAIRIDEKGNYLEEFKFEEDLSNIQNHNPIIHTSIMFRNNKIMYREKFHYAEDYDLYLRILSIRLEIRNINEILVKSRMRSSSISLNNISKGKLFTQKAQEFYIQRIKTGKDEYDSFNEKEILNLMNLKNEDSSKIYLKSVIGFSLRNGNIDEAKQYFKEYSKMINAKERIIYGILLSFPLIYSIRYKAKLFINRYINRFRTIVSNKIFNISN